MLNIKKISIFTRAIVFMLAIQVLNLSVNSIDFKPFATTDIAEFNDINTVAEYISEIVLGKVNAFPEFSSKTQKQSQLQKHISLKIINDQPFADPELVSKANLEFGIPLKVGNLYEYYQEINPPPPKA